MFNDKVDTWVCGWLSSGRSYQEGIDHCIWQAHYEKEKPHAVSFWRSCENMLEANKAFDESVEKMLKARSA